jgi:hypothetical protein
MANLIKSSTGGYIKATPTGLVHTAGEQAYSGRLAEEGLEAKVYDAPKRGRGRPRKDTGASGASYDFTALIGKIKIPKWTGPVRKIAARV